MEDTENRTIIRSRHTPTLIFGAIWLGLSTLMFVVFLCLMVKGELLIFNPATYPVVAPLVYIGNYLVLALFFSPFIVIGVTIVGAQLFRCTIFERDYLTVRSQFGLVRFRARWDEIDKIVQERFEDGRKVYSLRAGDKVLDLEFESYAVDQVITEVRKRSHPSLVVIDERKKLDEAISLPAEFRIWNSYWVTIVAINFAVMLMSCFSAPDLDESQRKQLLILVFFAGVGCVLWMLEMKFARIILSEEKIQVKRLFGLYRFEHSWHEIEHFGVTRAVPYTRAARNQWNAPRCQIQAPNQYVSLYWVVDFERLVSTINRLAPRSSRRKEVIYDDDWR